MISYDKLPICIKQNILSYLDCKCFICYNKAVIFNSHYYFCSYECNYNYLNIVEKLRFLNKNYFYE